MEKIVYEPHPVTPQRKAELRAQGYKIIDAKFKPPEAEKPKDKPEPASGHRQGNRKRKQSRSE